MAATSSNYDSPSFHDSHASNGTQRPTMWTIPITSTQLTDTGNHNVMNSTTTESTNGTEHTSFPVPINCKQRMKFQEPIKFANNVLNLV